MISTKEGQRKGTMTHVLDLYDRLTSATDDRTRGRIIADAFAELELRYSNLSEVATRTHLSETKLKLIKEIEQVRSELKETELRLQKEIEKVKADLSIQIKRTRANILQWSFMFWLTQFAAIVAILWRVWG
jgi:hypothetical protein